MRKLILLIIFILTMTGCNSYEKVDSKKKGQCLVTFCDKEYNIEYIRDICNYQGGITIRLNSDGNVIHCKKGDN